MEWVAIPFSMVYSWSRDPTWVSCIVDRLFTLWVSREDYTHTHTHTHTHTCIHTHTHTHTHTYIYIYMYTHTLINWRYWYIDICSMFCFILWDSLVHTFFLVIVFVRFSEQHDTSLNDVGNYFILFPELEDLLYDMWYFFMGIFGISLPWCSLEL